MIFDLLIITSILVFILDYSGFIPEVEEALGKWLKITARIPKPFSCSLCMSWWIGLIYIIVNDFSLINILYLVLLCILTPAIGNVMFTLRDVTIWLTNKIQKLID